MSGRGGIIEALVVEVWRYKRLAWGRWDKSANRCFVQVKLIDVCISLSTGKIDHLCIYYRFQQTLSFNPFDLFSILTRRERKKKKES